MRLAIKTRNDKDTANSVDNPCRWKKYIKVISLVPKPNIETGISWIKLTRIDIDKISKKSILTPILIAK